MSAPVPAPRQGAPVDVKKPVPTPRRSVQQLQMPKTPPKSPMNTMNNTISRRVRSLSNASKQIAEDIGELMHDKRRAVIEGTRQSVRKITKRFNASSSSDSNVSSGTPPSNGDEDLARTMDIFSSIRFNSPITNNQNIYHNVDPYSSSPDDYIGCPPPSHPPPPLPEDVCYDAPSSVASSSTTSTEVSSSNNNNNNNNHSTQEVYESVFPIVSSDSDKESSSQGIIDNNSVNLSRSESWKFYDSVMKNENIYNDIDVTTTTLIPEDLASCTSVEIRNSIYENHDIKEAMPIRGRPSDSVILQFDPLKTSITNDTANVSNNNGLQMLEQLLQGDLYGNLSSIQTLDDSSWSISNESEPDEFVTPPSPPIRYDSLPEEEQQSQQQSASSSAKTKSHWFTSSQENPKTAITEPKRLSWLKQVKGVLDKNLKSKDAVVQRPEINGTNFVHKKGMLYKVQGGPVEDLFGEYSGRWCVLQNSNMFCYSDTTCDTVKEHFPADAILSIQILKDPKYKYKYDNEDLHCFELNITGKSRGGHIYGSRDVSERRIWMQCITESLTNRFSNKLTTDYTRMGWAYVREGVSGQWMGAWLLLSRRTLYYAIDDQPVKSTNLRKARCIVLQMYSENDSNPRTNDKGPNMVVDTPNLTLYIRMWTSRETKVWCHIVKVSAHNNGANLDQQQLTKNNVPVVVEKCINFIYAHGSMSEGIYRKPGIGSTVTEILSKFRKDAWAVQLTHDKCTEHDIATALKRFFRDLPEPLLSSNQRQYFHQVALVLSHEEKVRMYKAAFDQLPPISYNTAKKLLGHLHFISTQSTKNLMNADNLGAIWGPTLMHYEQKDVKTLPNNTHQQDSMVVKQLVELYRHIFPEDPAELEQERLMLEVLERYTKCPQGAINNKKAGDFRVWIYLHSKDGETFNVSIGPNKTAYDICLELSQKTNFPVHQLILEEVVLNDKLIRPIHYSEKVLDTVLRWGYWDEIDRKDNHLIITRLAKYFDFIQDKQLPVISGELKFADMKTKTFRLYMFEFSQAKLTCFKDKSCEMKLHSWNVEDIMWYLGHENKRNPQSRWTVTFIETKDHPKRTKNTPFFGNVIAWTDPSTRANWLAAMLKARYPDSLTPPAMHVNLLST